MDMVWLRCSLNWSCYNLCSLAVWWLGPHGSQHGALQPSPALAPLPALAPSLRWARRPLPTHPAHAGEELSGSSNCVRSRALREPVIISRLGTDPPWGHLVCLWDGDSDVLFSGQELLCAAEAGQETPA